jgi:hypothetical protein
MGKAMLLLFALLVIVTAIGAIGAPDRGIEEPAGDRSASVMPSKKRTDLVSAGQGRSVTVTLNGSEMGNTGDLWDAFSKALRVERVAPEQDERGRRRSIAKKEFHRMRGVLQELRNLGLAGEALYEATESRLDEQNAEGALIMLEGYRRLEEDLAAADLNRMEPEERFAYLVQARREAFGEQRAEDLFLENEAYRHYKFEEQAILQDPYLTEEEKQSEIIRSRNALQVELASQGSYVSFANERRQELDRRLRERHGDAVETMSEEEREAAVWDLYRAELPPEMLAKAKQVLAAQAQQRVAFEALQETRETIMNDEDLSFEQKQELMEELSAQNKSGG